MPQVRGVGLDQCLAAALVGTLQLYVARGLKHPGATGAETLASTLSLVEFYQQMRDGALKELLRSEHPYLESAMRAATALISSAVLLASATDDRLSFVASVKGGEFGTSS